jgi:hypothetical protein
LFNENFKLKLDQTGVDVSGWWEGYISEDPFAAATGKMSSDNGA